MLALYRAGRQADALQAFRRRARLLRDELGLDPSPALQRLEQQILNQDPELAAPDAFAPARHTAAYAKPSGIVTFLVTGAAGPHASSCERSSANTAGSSSRRTATPCSSPFPAHETRSPPRSAVQRATRSSRGLRIGISSAEAIATDEGYTGPASGARPSISRAAHPGQILLSQTTRDLLRETPLTRPTCSTWASTA